VGVKWTLRGVDLDISGMTGSGLDQKRTSLHLTFLLVSAEYLSSTLHQMTKHSAISLTAVFVLSVFLSSCATVLNGRTQHIQITTDEKIRRVSVDNALFTDSSERELRGSAAFVVRRSHEPLFIHAQLDSGEKIIRLRPHISIAFWLNLDYFGLGMLVDMNNPKRYGYNHWNYLALKDTTIVLRRFAPVPKGTMHFSLSPLPSVNLFSLKSPEGQSTLGGPLGLAIGVDYFYQPDRYISFSMGTGTSAFADQFGNGSYFNTGQTFFGSIMNNHVIGSFDLGYGLNFSDLIWRKLIVTDIFMVNLAQSVRSAGIGPSFSAQYRITKSLRLGILYQPTLFSFNSRPAFGYQHYISAGFVWKWRIRR
jgi:hypothetical protein